ncbi:MAG: hypothetical protein CMK59_06665 [Proteobacteria bacterium]|nr:hypothetical protein [Pseudomonadota bacterium]
MIRYLLVLLMLFSNVVFAKQRVAVLEFRGVGIDQNILFQLSDESRGGAREGLPIHHFDITSRENMRQILEDMGKDMSSCDVECEVSLGRVVGADYVLSGTIFQAEGVYILTLKLHDTISGSLLGQKRIQNSSQVQLFAETYAVSKSMMTEKIVGAQQNQSTEQVLVTFTSSPAGEGVTVLVGGRPICSKTPCTESVPSGQHEIQILRKAYFPWIETQNLSANVTVKASLKPTFATLSVNSYPAGLPLSLNGQVQSIQSTILDPGAHRVLLKDTCYVEEGLELTLKAGDQKDFTIHPIPRKAGIFVVAYDQYTEPIPAKVYVDSKLIGEAPVRSVVPLCSKTLRVEYGNASGTQSLSLKEHQVSNVNINVR